jgi:hypothetical protein
MAYAMQLNTRWDGALKNKNTTYLQDLFALLSSNASATILEIGISSALPPPLPNQRVGDEWSLKRIKTARFVLADRPSWRRDWQTMWGEVFSQKLNHDDTRAFTLSNGKGNMLCSDAIDF